MVGTPAAAGEAKIQWSLELEAPSLAGCFVDATGVGAAADEEDCEVDGAGMADADPWALGLGENAVADLSCDSSKPCPNVGMPPDRNQLE